MDVNGWVALASYQSQLSVPLLLTSFDLLGPGITCNLIGIVQHVDQCPDRTSLGLTDYGTVSVRLTIWRNRARSVQSIRPGAVILATYITIKEYQDRLQGSVTDLSRIFHLQAPVPPHSFIGTRVNELLQISNKLFPAPSVPAKSIGDDHRQRWFDTMDEALMAVESGVYIGPAKIRIRLPLQSTFETATNVVQRTSVSYEYRELPIVIDDHIQGVAEPDVVRILCADLCPSTILTKHRQTVFELLRCLNAPSNSPFYCRIQTQVTIQGHEVSNRTFTVVSISC